jgi:hypothetical protein
MLRRAFDEPVLHRVEESGLISAAHPVFVRIEHFDPEPREGVPASRAAVTLVTQVEEDRGRPVIDQAGIEVPLVFAWIAIVAHCPPDSRLSAHHLPTRANWRASPRNIQDAGPGGAGQLRREPETGSLRERRHSGYGGDHQTDDLLDELARKRSVDNTAGQPTDSASDPTYPAPGALATSFGRVLVNAP